MRGQSQTSWLTALGAVLALAWGHAPAPAQEAQPPLQPLKLSRNIPGDSKPIILSADDIATWSENGQRVILLSGKALVEHGVLVCRAQRVVAFIDEGRYRQTRVLRVECHAEGEVRVEEGNKAQAGPKGLIDLNTRGELKLKSRGKAVSQQAQTNDPLYQRAMAERTPPPPAAPPPQTPPAGLQQTGYPNPTSGGGLAPAQGFSTPGQPSGLQPVQGIGTPPLSPGPPTLQPPIPGGAALPPGPPRDAGGVPVPQPPVSPGIVPPPLPPGAGALVPGPPGSGPPRNLSIRPRTIGTPFQMQSFPMPSGEQAIVVAGGVILTVSNDARAGTLDIEADRLVLWTRGNTQEMFNRMKEGGETTRELEFYLAGNVEIRQQSPNRPESRILRADEVYYDVGRSVAVATTADLEITQPKLPFPVHLRAQELLQTSANTFEVIEAQVSASKLPSDPGIAIYFRTATLESRQAQRRSIFGRSVANRDTGAPIQETELYFQGRNVFLEVEDVPVFYLPYLAGRADDPLGPLETVNIGFNNIFGFQLGVSLDLYELLGIDPPSNTRWRFDVDYLSKRGPGLGTDFRSAGTDLFGIRGRYASEILAWGLRDTGQDNLGGGRGFNDGHPEYRGWVKARFNWFDLPYGFTVQSNISPQSDHNFYEQYYKTQFDTDINQETFLYVKQQQGNWAWTGLAEVRIRDWIAETSWLPRADGYLIGQSFFDMFTYNAHASAGYGLLRPSNAAPEPTPGAPPPGPITTLPVDTGRFDLWQELSLPFYLGPVKVAPYGRVDLTQYTEDLTGNARGRFYGAAGNRASMPFTRLYPDVDSELFNLHGINHKIVFSSNYYYAHSDTPFSRLPQLDRINDDATDQAIRNITPIQPSINAPNGLFLQTNPMFNPQIFALRNLVENRIDTLDSIQELQFDIRQRLQTKRGYPGNQHIVDWMVLDVGGTYFPQPTTDAFGGVSSTWGFLNYDYTWNIGDRTALVSTGWMDAVNVNANEWTVGAYLNRPDRTNYFVGYRQIDILQSKAVTGALTYIFSPKYAMTGSTVYDFGTAQALSNSLTLTRLGTDVQVSLGVTYNVLQNNFGMVFQIVPNLLPTAGRLPGLSLMQDPTAGYRQ